VLGEGCLFIVLVPRYMLSLYQAQLQA
jgi:hypothetical protein